MYFFHFFERISRQLAANEPVNEILNQIRDLTPQERAVLAAALAEIVEEDEQIDGVGDVVSSIGSTNDEAI
jgi:hypothetical protein